MNTFQNWRKSSYSVTADNCVEIADDVHRVAVRDTKNRAAGTLTFSREAWTSFVTASNPRDE